MSFVILDFYKKKTGFGRLQQIPTSNVIISSPDIENSVIVYSPPKKMESLLNFCSPFTANWYSPYQLK